MISFLVNYTKGILLVSVTGSYLERFFNLCAKNNIGIWNIKKVGLGEVHLNILIEDYKKLNKIISNSKCNIKIIKKSGMPFILSKIKNRYALIGGFFVCFITYYILTSYLFSINIIGTEKTAMIYEALEQNNVKIGTKLDTIKATEVRNNIILQNDEILWLAINIKGNMANIIVYEREKLPEIIQKDTPCDIVADKTGMIDTIEILSGQKVIDKGHTFLEGDILVSSEVEGISQMDNTSTRLVHSIANIKASIWYDVTRVLSSEIFVKNYTGEQKTVYSLIFDKKEINFMKNTSNLYAFYDKIVDIKKITLSPSVTIPVYIKIETYKEYTPVSYQISSEVGFKMLSNSILQSVKNNIDGDIIKTKENATTHNSSISVNMKIETLEKIGVEQER